ncbi:hypothetical protein [Clostridium guangxiense]|uniref:hypothetical protein n=1 Tax=Clostridium guangxiense TaxID=1662055 RepID=UPI001E290281|nr:hypothetical protein [Clostridium guangxiense]MCD2345147.1 hypothetical protein [Clostridium guangxiense]
MLKKEDEVYILILTLIKCFLVLIIFGMLLPEMIDKITTYFTLKAKLNSDSDFVYNIISSKETIVKFIYFFRLSIR